MRRALVPLLFGLALLSGDCASVRPLSLAVPPGHFRVLSYNLKFDGWPSLRTRWAVQGLEADLICLQEVTPHWQADLRSSLRSRYPHQVFETDRGAAGLAIVSRWPLEKVQWLSARGNGWFPALAAVVQTPAGPVRILNVHLRPMIRDDGRPFDVDPRTHDHEIRAFLADLPQDLPLIVAGDFNEDHAGLATAFLLQSGMNSALSVAGATGPTWRSQEKGVNVAERLDDILYTDHLECSAAAIVQRGGSDHLPVLAVIGPPRLAMAPARTYAAP